MEQTIEQLNRKVALLDQYSSTLQRQNCAKNNETQTLYRQLHQMRMENQILKNHLDKIITANQIKSVSKMNLNEVSCSVDLDSNHKIQQKNFQNVYCQTQSQPEIQNIDVHFDCTHQIQLLSSALKQKQNKINQLEKQSTEMYETIVELEKQNQRIKKQTNQIYMKKSELQMKNKQKSSQLRLYHEQNSQLKAQIKQLIDIKQNIQTNLATNSSRSNIDRQSTMALTIEVQRLIKENNKLIQRVRMLQKEKNNYYKELKSVSPLKKSQINENKQFSIFNQTNKNTIMQKNNLFYQTQNKKQKFSDQFTIGKQKQKMKSERWQMIQNKINAIKSQNQSLKANLNYY